MQGNPVLTGGSAADKPTRAHTFPVCTRVGFFCSVPNAHRIPTAENIPERQKHLHLHLQEPQNLNGVVHFQRERCVPGVANIWRSGVTTD